MKGGKCAFEKCADISRVFHPLPSSKTAWCDNFTIAVFPLHSAYLFCFGFLSVARHCVIVFPRTPVPHLFTPLCLALCLCFFKGPAGIFSKCEIGIFFLYQSILINN